jgi:signal transduction histidine kinase
MAGHKFDPETKAAMDEGLELAEKVSKGIRSLSYFLHPPLLDEAGLRSALPWLTDSISKTSKIAISLEFIPEEFPRLPPEIETAVFRIVQEALANVRRHSGSANADVMVERTRGRVCLQVRDYGKGIAENIQEILLPSNAVGIGGMRERSVQLGGDLTIRPAHPGTFLEAWFPYE